MALSDALLRDYKHHWHPRHAPPPTPPYSSDALPMSATTTLPPIASFDTCQSYVPSFVSHSPPPRLPPIHSPRTNHGRSRPLTPSPTPPPPQPLEIADWFSESQSWSSLALAEKTCEMICYLWFSKAAVSPSASLQHSPHQSYMPHRSSNTAYLQFSVSSVFVNFMHKLLQTTQLSQSVIVLSLHYVYRLKARNRTTVPSPGSEFRVAVAGLMMANKFVDDNTYTNKTWSEVSGIELPEINKMEREILAGIDFELYVDKQTYESWVNLLKGLVLAKERDSRHFRRARQSRVISVARPTAATNTSLRLHHRNAAMSPRARSSSPVRHSLDMLAQHQPKYVAVNAVMDMNACAAGKRSAVDAFSPTSASFDLERPSKRPTSLALDIPQTISRTPSTPSPLDPIQFSKLSLGSSPAIHQPKTTHEPAILATRHISPQTLVAAYRLDPTKPRSTPQNLYFYSLAGSPLPDENRSRKGRLHYYQPPSQTAPLHPYSRQPAPVMIQSAHASPHDRGCLLPPVLPLSNGVSWMQSRSCCDARSCVVSSRGYDTRSEFCHNGQNQAMTTRPLQDTVPSAPFANAGPPGVHYHMAPQFSPDSYFVRGRVS